MSLLAVLAVFAGALGWSTLQSAAPASAAGETIISTFYVPLFEDNARAALFAVNGGTGTQLSSTTSITVGAEDAIIYYDHWEDSYEALANVRVQTSTLVFGDGDLTNGNAATYCVPARCAGDNLPVGAVLRLNNSATVVPGPITTPRASGTVVFDGRDKISSTDGLAVTHATWPTAIDALHSEMAAAFDTSRWGVNFSAPVGINTPAQGAGTTSFSYTGIEVMAREAGTQVYIDTNNNGVYTDPGDVNGTTIGEGQTVYVNGNVREGAKVVATKAVQVFLMTGVIGSNYENRSFQVFPTEGLVNDYVAPASSARASGTLYATVLYLFNPQVTPITVNVQTTSGTTPYTIPAGQTLNPAPVLPNGSGAQVTSTATFAAVAGIGTREASGNSLNYDWGYSLLPARVITDSLVVGWAPGSQNLSVAGYDPVWVVTLAPTTLFIDYDADPSTGANTDPNGSRYDTAVTVATALSQLRITDTADNDMTGAHVYTVDGVGVAAAYGEDPAATTPVAFPGIDLGTTLFPACGALCVRKLATISVDVDGDGLIDPGDTLTWSVEATNTDYYTLINPVLFDTLPSGLQYVPGSTTAIINGDPPVAVADDVVPPAATLFPYDESGRQISANIPVGGVVSATFDTVVDPEFAGTAPICNRAIVTSQRETLLTPANGADTTCVLIDGLRIVKTSDSGGNPVLPGDELVYTLTVTNASSSTVTGVAVTDPLPAGLTWVSTSVTAPALTTTTAVDDFQTTGSWGGGTGWTAAAWTETDGGGAGDAAGRLRKVTDAGDRSAQFRNGSLLNEGISRVAADFSLFSSVALTLDRRCVSLEAGDAVALEVRPNGSAAWIGIDVYNNCDDAGYVAESYTLTAGQFGTATEVRLRVSDGFAGGGTDNLFIDNLQLTRTERVVAPVAGAAPPNLVTLTDLLPTEQATIVVTTTVNDPYTATDEITNIATVRTGNQVAQATVVDCVRCFDFSDDPGTFNGSGGLDPGRARASSYRTLIADTFQSVGYSGSTGTADWSGASWSESDSGGAGPGAGLVQNVIDASTRAVRIGSAGGATGATTTFSRVVGDLSSFTTVSLGFEYRCSNLGSGDVVELQVRPTAAAGWTTLQTFTTCNNPTIYSNQDLTLAPAAFGTATEIRLAVTAALEANEFFFFDDVQVRAVADGTTVGPRLGTAFDREVQGAGGASPFPATAPAAPTGDDLDGVDDEDGVVVPAVDVNTLDVPITVTDATGGVSYVNGWFDWDNDGAFQTDESLFQAGTFVSATGGLSVVSGTGLVPGPGTYTVTINIPDLDTNGSGYAIGDTLYSRFRVATLLSGVSTATTASLDGEVEDYSSTLNTLPVSISFVGSRRTGGKVAIDWRTAQEVDNLGFNLYAEAVDGTLTQLNEQLVLTQAPTSIEAHEYSLTVLTRAAAFWIEDVSLDGVTELHGPYTVGQQVGDPAPPAQIDWAPAQEAAARASAAARRAELRRARAESARRVASPATAATGPVARLEVTEAGVQQVTYEQLLAAGVDLAGVPAASLAVTDAHGPLQIELVGNATFGPGSALRFIGEPLDTIYTGTNVYRVHIDATLARRVAVVAGPPPPTTPPPGRRVEDQTEQVPGGRRTTTTTSTTPATSTTFPTAGSPVTAYLAIVTLESNLSYSVAAPGEDPWFESMLVSVAGSPASVTSSVTVTDPIAGQPAQIAATLWGITRDAIVDDHHVALTVNGVPVADARFDDNDALRLSGEVPAGVLVPGSNTLELTLVGDTGASVDIVVVDAWEVQYLRATTAIAGRLDLTASGDRVDVAGMPAGEVLAYRIAADGTVTKLPTAVAAGITQVPGSATAERYVLSAAGAVHAPAVAPAPAPADLLGGPADYLVVTNGMFNAALAPLVAYHESQGRVVKVVDVAAVYEGYSHGVVDAAAIDAYIAEAVPALGATWVLLVGADSVDYRDYDDDGSFSLLPSPYGDTGFSVTYAPIDPAYADIDGDGVPDVALGRMPARTPAELSTMVLKTIAYAAQQTGQSVLLVSDTADGVDYAGANDGVEALFDGWTVHRSDIDRGGVDAARDNLLSALDGGVGVTFYLGHSGSHEWTELGLFDATAAAALMNADTTVIVQFGCWNTYYVAPDADTMAHALLLNPNGGAAAVLGATTLTSSGNDIQFAGYLATHLAAGDLTIGEAVLLAKQDLQLHAGGSTRDVQFGWTILGDPAISVGGNG